MPVHPFRTPRLLLHLCTLVFPLLFSLPGAAQPLDPIVSMAEKLKGNVVAIRATFPDGSTEQGFGFITGEQGSRLFIATAAHVVFNGREPSSVKVKFHNDISWVSATFKRHWDDPDDLALLEMTKPAWVNWKTDFSDFSPRDLQSVRFLGRYQGGEPRWLFPGSGEVFEVGSSNISFTINTILPGCSGAPLISAGGIIGLIVSDAGADSKALRLSRIRELFSNNGQYPYFGSQAAGATSSPTTQPTIQNPTSNPNLATPLQKLETDMALITGGTFTMGCKSGRDTDCYDDEKPAHEVRLRDFNIGKYEVTQAQWRAVMGSDPPELYNKGCDQCPVERVSWNDIQDFLKKLNTLTGKRYRLPTEAEWEYAARGGNQSRGYLYSGSNTIGDVAWYDANAKSGNTNGAQKTTRPVGTKKPNELGLYDMSGNVWEWCEDDWHDNYIGAPTDGSAWVDSPRGGVRVLRGGSWSLITRNCRAADRVRYNTSDRYVSGGFRLARD
jgi:formylglycine-generating enzyme